MATIITYQCDCCKKVYSAEEIQEVGMQTLKWDLQCKAGKPSVTNFVKQAQHIDMCIDMCFPCLQEKKILHPKFTKENPAPPNYYEQLADNLMRILEGQISELVKEHLPNQ